MHALAKDLFESQRMVRLGSGALMEHMLREVAAGPIAEGVQMETTPIIEIVNNALRAAALAPTYIDALDVAGAALTAIAELARAELRHG